MRYTTGFSSPTNGVTRFLIILIATYLCTALLSKTAIGYSLYSYLVLNPYAVINYGQVWRLITYGFLHDITSPMHVILNALMLYMIGPTIERLYGEKKFNILVFFAILMGGVFVEIAYLLNLSNSMVLGFSAVTAALIIIWGLNYPDHIIYLFALIPVSGRQIVYLTLGFEILYAFSSNGISSSAHLGGITAAYIFVFELYKPHRLKHHLKEFRNKRRFK